MAMRSGSASTVVVPNLCSTVAGKAPPSAAAGAVASAAGSSSLPQPAKTSAAMASRRAAKRAGDIGLRELGWPNPTGYPRSCRHSVESSQMR